MVHVCIMIYVHIYIPEGKFESGWPTIAEDHIRFHACQPRTEIWGYYEHRLELDSWILKKKDQVIFSPNL